MKFYKIYLSSLFLVLITISCSYGQKNKSIINPEEVSPWCIIGFDTKERTPKQRIHLLKKLNLSKYGYNRGKGDLTKMKEEFDLAQKNNIEITSIFLWLNAKRDSIGHLGTANKQLLNNLKNIKQKPTIWVSFSDNFFKKLNQQESIQLSVDMIKHIKSKTDQLGCKLALYNHHGWFGNPYHQLEILNLLNDDSITMVYNFHHAHEHVDEFSDIAKKITPHLSYVNLNGVKKEGPQILPINKGDYEYKMVKTLLKNNYQGPWGILGHIKTKDVEVVLKENLEGLKELNKKLNKK